MPYIEEYFEPNLVEIGLTVLDEKFLKFRQVFLLFRSNLPLETFAQTWMPFTQGYFVPSLVESGPVVLEKKMKMWKVYDNDDNDEQQTKLT